MTFKHLLSSFIFTLSSVRCLSSSLHNFTHQHNTGVIVKQALWPQGPSPPIDQLINPHYWLAVSWLPSHHQEITSSPKAWCMCVFFFVCVRIYDGGCHSSLDYWEVRRGTEGGRVWPSHTQKCTHYPGSKRCKQRARNHIAGDFLSYSFHWPATLLPSLPPSPFLPALLPLLLFF